MKIRCFLARYFMALLALVSAILCILHAHRHKLMPPPSSPPAIGGNYSAGTPTAPPAIGSGYSAGTPTAPRPIAGNWSAGSPSAPPAIRGGAANPAQWMVLYHEAPGIPTGRFAPLGTSASLGAVWVMESDIGSVSLNESGELRGSGTVWVQRDGGLFAWSMERSANWASASPDVFFVQSAGDASRATTPTPVDVDAGGWNDVVNDWDPEQEAGFTLDFEGLASPPACSTNYTPGTPSAPPAIS